MKDCTDVGCRHHMGFGANSRLCCKAYSRWALTNGECQSYEEQQVTAEEEELEPVVPQGTMVLTDSQVKISAVLMELNQILLDKNRKYGNSALKPCRIFSKASAIEQINVRLDDKLSRIISGQADEDEDILVDIIGYCVLKIIKMKEEEEEEVGEE